MYTHSERYIRVIKNGKSTKFEDAICPIENDKFDGHVTFCGGIFMAKIRERERERASDSDYSDSFKEIPKTPVEMIEAG